MTELLIVTLAGVVPGLLLAAWAVPALLALNPAAARALGVVTIDPRVQALTVLLGAGTAFAAAMVPAWAVSQRDVSAALSQGARRLTGGRSGLRARRVLVAVQVALCLALLMSSALVLEGLRRAGRIDPGFVADGVLTAQLRLPAEAYDTTERRADVVARLLPRMRALPGVTAASTTMGEFVPGNFFQSQFHVEGRPTADGQPRTSAFNRVSSEYLATMRIPVLRGRPITEADATSALAPQC